METPKKQQSPPPQDDNIDRPTTVMFHVTSSSTNENDIKTWTQGGNNIGSDSIQYSTKQIIPNDSKPTINAATTTTSSSAIVKHKREKSSNLKMPRKSKEERNSKYPYTPDFENNVIQRQRRELQQLVAELRDRDRELNDVVAGHQRQISGWDADRRRIQQLDDRVKLLEGQIADRQTQLQTVNERCQTIEKKLQEKSEQCHELKNKNDKFLRQHEHQKRLIEELEEHSEQLERKVNELNLNAELFNNTQHDMLTELRKRENEVFQRTQDYQELLNRCKTAETHLKSQEQAFKQCATKCQELNTQLEHQTHVNEILKEDLRKVKHDANCLFDEKDKLVSEIARLRKENQLTSEREKRKDEIIQSHRLRQERYETEINQLRQLYERMQNQLSQLQAVDDVHGDDSVDDNFISRQYHSTTQSLSNFNTENKINSSTSFLKLNSNSNIVTPRAAPTMFSSTNHYHKTLTSQSSTFPDGGRPTTTTSLLNRVNSSPDLAKGAGGSLIDFMDTNATECNFILTTSRNITDKYNKILSELN